MSSIDLGNEPVGTPPTPEEQAQIRAAIGAIPDAPADGKPYARQDEDWAEVNPLTPAVTQAEVEAGTVSASRTFSPLRVRQAGIETDWQQHLRRLELLGSYFTLASTGAGVATAPGGGRTIRLDVGTSPSTASACFIPSGTSDSPYNRRGSSMMNFSRPIRLGLRLSPSIDPDDATGRIRVKIGNITANSIGDLVASNVAYAMVIKNNGDLDLQVADGTTLTTVNINNSGLYTSVTQTSIFELRISGSGVMEVWYRGVKQGQVTGGPTVATSTLLQVETAGTASSLRVSRITRPPVLVMEGIDE